jgi:hypothetical protein
MTYMRKRTAFQAKNSLNVLAHRLEARQIFSVWWRTIHNTLSLKIADVLTTV